MTNTNTKGVKKVLWFSRHIMTEEQRAVLGDNVVINQVDRSLQHAAEIKDEIDDADIIAIVAPLALQAEFLKLAGDKPVIIALNDRVIIKDPDGGESKAEFHFVKWERLVRLEIVKEDFTISD